LVPRRNRWRRLRRCWHRHSGSRPRFGRGGLGVGGGASTGKTAAVGPLGGLIIDPSWLRGRRPPAAAFRAGGADCPPAPRTSIEAVAHDQLGRLTWVSARRCRHGK
jgi:hypothetical protein